MLKDRGTIKWTALMLPEHVELLKQLWEEDKKVNKPIIDYQELELINHNIKFAYGEKKAIHLLMYDNGYLQEYEGIIKRIDPLSNHIILLTDDKTRHTILLPNIISAQTK